MVVDDDFQPRLFNGDALHEERLARAARKASVELDGNPDGNAMMPQRLTLKLHSGATIRREITATLGSPEAPMNTAQSAQKYDLCRKLAGDQVDPRLFQEPLLFATDPQ